MRKRCRRGQQPAVDPMASIASNLSRLVEPVVLYLLATDQAHYGYQFLEAVQDFALTDAEIDSAVIYRTLRALEAEGLVVSDWAPGAGGPAKRVYKLTPAGLTHLKLWAQVLDQRGRALVYFAQLCAEL